MSTLRAEGARLVITGVTTVSEIVRVVGDAV